MKMVYTNHRYSGGEVTFATRGGAQDPFSVKLRGEWKPDTHTDVACQLVGHGDYFLDLGANMGAFCLPVSKATGARCLAVEALQSNIPMLQSSIEANDMVGQVSWILAAIVEKNGEVRIAGESAYGTVRNDLLGQRVISYSLDGLMHDTGWEDVKLLKMDIEGCELRALQGASEFFFADPRCGGDIRSQRGSLPHKRLRTAGPRALFRAAQQLRLSRESRADYS